MANVKEGLVVTLKQIDEHTIWISSNEDPFGKEVEFDDIDDVESQMMITVADYFDLDLEFDDVDEDESDDEEMYYGEFDEDYDYEDEEE